MWGAHDGMAWWMLLGSIWFVVLLAGCVYSISWLGRHGVAEHPKKETPLEILKRRYALGELSQEEFDRMRREIL